VAGVLADRMVGVVVGSVADVFVGSVAGVLVGPRALFHYPLHCRHLVRLVGNDP
jgi:hypothetical protein